MKMKFNKIFVLPFLCIYFVYFMMHSNDYYTFLIIVLSSQSNCYLLTLLSLYLENEIFALHFYVREKWNNKIYAKFVVFVKFFQVKLKHQNGFSNHVSLSDLLILSWWTRGERIHEYRYVITIQTFVLELSSGLFILQLNTIININYTETLQISSLHLSHYAFLILKLWEFNEFKKAFV